MSLIRMISVSALAASLLVQQAAAQDTRSLAPNSNWVLNYDEDSCALQRGFGEEGEAVFLEFRQFEPGPVFQMTVASSDIEIRRAEPQVRYGSDAEPWVVRNGNIADFGDGLRAIVFNDSFSPIATKAQFQEFDANERRLARHAMMRDLPAIQARESTIESITVLESFGDEITLDTGSMQAPMDAMRQCLVELLTHWGIDAQAHRTLTRPAMPRNYDRMVRRVIQNYPTSMLRAGNNARLQVRLGVNAEGEVTGCHLQVPIEHDDFREEACDSLERARFDPALDADGNPIDSYWTSTVSYFVM